MFYFFNYYINIYCIYQQFFKKILPCGLCAATPLLKKMSNEDDTKQSVSEAEKKLIRPSELPIYSVEACARKIPW